MDVPNVNSYIWLQQHEIDEFNTHAASLTAEQTRDLLEVCGSPEVVVDNVSPLLKLARDQASGHCFGV